MNAKLQYNNQSIQYVYKVKEKELLNEENHF